MRTMLLAFATIAVVAVIADTALDYAGFSAQDQGTGPATRVD